MQSRAPLATPSKASTIDQIAKSNFRRRFQGGSPRTTSERKVGMKRTASIMALTAALFAGVANAADLPSTKAPPLLPPPPPFLWTGIYAGVNIGYGWNDGGRLSGVVGGGQIGYNYQFTPLFVAGLEADIQGTSLSTSGDGFIYPGRGIDYYGTVRGRVGLSPLDPRLLIYGTGGFAYAQVRYSNGALNDNRTGWAAGGGLEWAFTPSISAKVEYLYVDIATQDLGAFPFPRLGVTKIHTVRAGLNYHFDVFPPAPLLARR
jgi:outer membrane immunogenic protein